MNCLYKNLLLLFVLPSSFSSNAAMNLQYKVQQSRKVAVSDALPLEVVPPAPVSQFIQLIYLANWAKHKLNNNKTI